MGNEAIDMVDYPISQRWRTTFNEYDDDIDGVIPLRDFKGKLLRPNVKHDLRPHVVGEILRKAERNEDGVLHYKEFVEINNVEPPKTPQCQLCRGLQSLGSFAAKLTVPRSKHPVVIDTNYGKYEAQYNCYPPPITIFTLSAVEIILFFFYSVKYGDASASTLNDTVLIYNPHRRYEAWRFLTYMLVHIGYPHIIFNVLVQLILGIPLEMVHKYWRVWLIFMAGVLAGSLGTSITDPNVYLAGASGGCFALITAHVATVILNFKSMVFPWVQLILYLSLSFLSVGWTIYSRYSVTDPNSKAGYAAHLTGALTGLLVGIVALRNLEHLEWDRVVWWICLSTYVVFIVAMVVWNIAIPSYFPPSE